LPTSLRKPRRRTAANLRQPIWRILPQVSWPADAARLQGRAASGFQSSPGRRRRAFARSAADESAVARWRWPCQPGGDNRVYRPATKLPARHLGGLDGNVSGHVTTAQAMAIAVNRHHGRRAACSAWQSGGRDRHGCWRANAATGDQRTLSPNRSGIRGPFPVARQTLHRSATANQVTRVPVLPYCQLPPTYWRWRCRACRAGAVRCNPPCHVRRHWSCKVSVTCRRF